MIELPAGLTVKRAKASERQLIEAGRSWLEREERTPGMHASDLLDPLQAFHRSKDPLPLSDREVVTFLVGKLLHAFVLGSVGGEVDLGVTDEGSKWSDLLGLSYSPDHLQEQLAEFKTTRSFFEPKDVGDLSLYLEQLLVYMVAEQRTLAYLWILYLNLKDETNRTNPAFRCFEINITQEELEAATKQLREKSVLLRKALDANDPSELPLCREWKCGARMCAWYDRCKPAGRYGQSKFDRGRS